MQKMYLTWKMLNLIFARKINMISDVGFIKLFVKDSLRFH